MHEAVFPIGESTAVPDTGSLAGDVREMLRRTAGGADHPGRARGTARPGRRDGRRIRPCTPPCWNGSATCSSRGLTEWLDDAAARGEVRPDVTAAELAEAVAGITLLALLTRGDDTRRRLGRAHRHPDHERNQRMTPSRPTSPPPRGANCSKPWAALTAPSSRATGRSPTTGTSPTATACSPPRWAWRSTPTCSPTRAGPVFVELNTPFRPRPAMGRRQHRRLLLHVPGRSRAPIPHQRQSR